MAENDARDGARMGVERAKSPPQGRLGRPDPLRGHPRAPTGERDMEAGTPPVPAFFALVYTA